MGERSLIVPLVFEVLSDLLTTSGGVVTALSELRIAAVGVVIVVGLRIDSWLAVKVDLIIDIGYVVAVEFVQGTVTVLVNSITEEGEANSVGVQLTLAVE